MADPVSITSLILEVSKILSSLVAYAKSVQGAMSEMRKLSEELFALKGILGHLSLEIGIDVQTGQQAGSVSSFNSEALTRVLQTTNEFLQSLLHDLRATKFKRLKQKLEWHFTQEQVNSYLAQLERVKSWLILVHNSAMLERLANLSSMG